MEEGDQIDMTQTSTKDPDDENSESLSDSFTSKNSPYYCTNLIHSRNMETADVEIRQLTLTMMSELEEQIMESASNEKFDRKI